MCRLILIPAGCLLTLLLGLGCNQPGQTRRTDTDGSLPALAPDTVLRLHWLGKRELAVKGGAFYVNRVWDLPETEQFEAYVFNRLTTAPWRLLKEPAAVQNAPAAALRPLMDNLAYEESYLEIRAEPNGLFELALAVRLNRESSQGWEGNLSVVAQSLTGYAPQPNRDKQPGWTLNHPQCPAHIDFVRKGHWTFLRVATSESRDLLDSLISHVSTSVDPFGARNTNRWIQVDANLNWLSHTLGLTTNTPSHLPSLHATVAGDGGHALTDCELRFPNPSTDSLQPWQVPEPLVGGPISSFMAVRSLPSYVTRLPGYSDLPLGNIPDQLYAWARQENPFLLFLATPLPDANNRMEALSDHLLNTLNPWLKENGPEINDQPCPLFHRSPGGGVLWGTMQGLQPFAQAVSGTSSDFLFTGLFPAGQAKNPTGLPPTLTEPLASITNLVYLGWEDTAQRLAAWTPVLQTARAVTGHAPMAEDSPALSWLKTLESRVATTQTTAVRTGADTVHIQRKSTLGLNAGELHLLADWIESPDFPRGLHTFLAESPRSAE